MKSLILSFFLFTCSGYVSAQIITTIAGSDNNGYNGDNILAINAELHFPYDVTFDDFGNLYIADGYNNRIRKIDTAGMITTIAGTGINGYNGDNIPATDAELYRPTGIICDHNRNIYIADGLNNRVRKVDATGIITTVAGNGIGGYNGDAIPAVSAEDNNPHLVALDEQGNLYITDWNNHRVRKVNISGIITTIAGTGIAGYTGDNGFADTAEINAPYGIAVDDIGNVYFADAYENVIRKINTSGVITTFAGGGTGTSIGDNNLATAAKLGGPGFISFDLENNLYIGDIGNQRIRKVIATSNIITTVAGNGIQGFSGDNGPATSAELNEPGGIAINAAGDLYFADFSNSRIRRIRNTAAVNNANSIENSLNIYPNPSNGLFTFSMNSNITEGVQIIITNAIGENVKEVNTFSNQSLVVQLNQPAGIYYLHAVTAHGIETKVINIIK